MDINIACNLSPLYLNTRLTETLPQPRIVHDFSPYGLRPYDFARQLLTSQTAVNKILVLSAKPRRSFFSHSVSQVPLRQHNALSTNNNTNYATHFSHSLLIATPGVQWEGSGECAFSVRNLRGRESVHGRASLARHHPDVLRARLSHWSHDNEM
ncbi:paired box protein Pax-6 [Caerostris extrusa]|uniref:Paired box protein Pax-6 n=1 Tax=Caerostris extrusa TaxID=172846 RepID=A0AAV4QRX6_CAEEX|nr:paired box protein Pax-6 [Caerostris extrusa]